MQKIIFGIACFLTCTTPYAQLYPFVHYSPKDGLVSNRVRSAYQDSKGRMYFLTMNGLSVYDGARFTNYTSEDGLGNDIVNCVMEMGDDSLWVVTNTSGISCLVRGTLKPLQLKDPGTPIINLLFRNERGDLYAAADQGLFLFQQNSFIRLPFTDMQGKDVNSYIGQLEAVEDFLLCLRDPGLGGTYILYLYDCNQKKIVSQTANTPVLNIAQSKDGRLWVSTMDGVKQVNKEELQKEKIVLQELPPVFKQISKKIGGISFDSGNNCWMSETDSLTKCDKNGNVTVYTSSSGLSSLPVNSIFQDKEGITWLASNGGGVDKLMHNNFTVLEKPFGLSSPTSLVLSASKKEIILYSYPEKKLVRFSDNSSPEISRVAGAEFTGQVLETSHGMYGTGMKKIFRLGKKNSSWYPEPIFTDTTANSFGTATADPSGNILIAGITSLTALHDKTVFQIPVNYLADQIVLDRKGDIWLVNRKEELVHYKIHRENTAVYLQQQTRYENELAGIAPRSLVLDGNGTIWIGTRYKGIFVFREKNKQLTLLHHLTSRSGLSENFVSYLDCDEDNAIWVCTPSGLDKIVVKNGIPVIENLTRQNNIYQSISKIVIDGNKTAWALFNSGLIKITPENHEASGFIPQLMFTHIRAGFDTLSATGVAKLSYTQNNLTFHFSAPSFMDEKQILYSYQLQGSSNTAWSEPSNNTMASFIDLRPGSYLLQIKARFPANRYPGQLLQYKFSILPPWWETWWFRTGMGIVAIGLLVAATRLYYRRKLERQKTILEKQQAVEKERTRIATDMHDDLGAGLSRIKFLSETIGIKKQKQESIDDEVNSIRSYSHEMIDKMGEIVWALNERNDSLNDLLAYTRSYAVEYLTQNGIRCTVETADEFPYIFVTGEFRRNIYLAVKEALHNIVKHAAAAQVFISFHIDDKLNITIKDDGQGFDPNRKRPYSNGLINMRKRMNEIGGSFEIKNMNGTCINLSAPLSL